jgi:hypothetical protein
MMARAEQRGITGSTHGWRADPWSVKSAIGSRRDVDWPSTMIGFRLVASTGDRCTPFNKEVRYEPFVQQSRLQG